MKRRPSTSILPLAAALGMALPLAACGAAEKHAFSETWKYDEASHWHECTEKGHTDVSDKVPHVYENDADTTCNVCGYERPAHAHSPAEGWSKDETYHWHKCTINGCEEELDKAEHAWDAGEVVTLATFGADGTKSYTCTVCGQSKAEPYVMEYIDLNYVKSTDGTPAGTAFTIPAAGTYYIVARSEKWQGGVTISASLCLC